MGIVGVKIETYLTGVGHDYGRRWIITRHTVVNELHATKGWRTISHHKKEQIRRDRPSTKEWRLNDVTTFKRTRPRRDRSPPIRLNETEMERARMRHAWYRRQKAWEALRASLPERNRL